MVNLLIKNPVIAITNGLISVDKPISSDQKVRKILKALPKFWEVKSTILKELNDKKEMDFTTFMGNLKTHEMKMNARKDREPHKKIGVAFKVSSREYKKNYIAPPTTSEDEQQKDEELTWVRGVPSS